MKRLRRSHRMTQRRLGECSSLRKRVVGNVEHGRSNLTLASLEALARGLRCAEAELLCHEHTACPTCPRRAHRNVVIARTDAGAE